MSTSIKRRKRIGKVLVLLLASGSLLGISPLTAMAEERSWTITVVVSDTSEEPCLANVEGATWSPDPVITYTGGVLNYDVGMGPAPASLDISLSLGFMDGEDTNFCPDSDASYPPTGSIESFFTSTSPELTVSSLECLQVSSPDDLCDAGDSNSHILTGSLSAPLTEGTHEATLRVVWTP